jgi:hypothetical protein
VVTKIISGGQTGVDRAGLDAGLALGIPIGGWCPRGRRAEDGVIPEKYPLIEMHSAAYPPRTRMNVVRSDATLLFRRGLQTHGSRETGYLCIAEDKKLVEVELEDLTDLAYEYIRERLNAIDVLNVAGPREASRPGIYNQAYDFIVRLFSEARAPCK